MAYQELLQVALDYQPIVIIPFSRTSALEYQRLRKDYLCIESMDLKNAAIALTSNAILFTPNELDFEQISGLRIED
ncbi:hypothetical protein H6F93_15115 [Leptolyngbya sp. FACHB-671]|uniref:hypothetical protein n=1 Tax=Leptolyngbya sp. FACHB-671 TaxID=2692812 RepID=UPI0016846CFF|nr:hypothetical protein [Leptolyngbya sp. FACHB-671]MBD2068837.1 hypothetical protein [Leptolyngbya sp. FACHB-671]